MTRHPVVRGALAGALAGLVTSVVALLLLEPVLERAIALEGEAGGPVSRTTQKYVGAPAGFVLTGLSLGLLFGLAYRIVPSPLDAWRRSTGLALAAFLALSLVPQLRYPANPPGVGDPATITGRTSDYLLALALGLVAVSGSVAALGAFARAGVAPAVRQVAVVTGGVLFVAAGYALLPDNTDAVDVPASLLWDFRVRSLGLQALLYALLGALFGLLSLRGHSRAVDAADRVDA